MRKFLLTFLTALAIVSCLLLASCGGGGDCTHTGGTATCTAKAICTSCNQEYGETLGHSWNAADCDTAKTCATCGATEGEALGHTWVNADCDTPKTCSTCNATEGAELGHTWVDADCDTPKTCSVCNATEGAELGHSWTAADCDTPKTCSECNATEGAELGHTWVDANCSAPKTCSACNATEGGLGDHVWLDATCEAPKTCDICDATEGELADHKWQQATCDAPRTCSVCELTDGEALGHAWSVATCDAPKTCYFCDTTDGQSLGHSWTDATCTAPKTCTKCGGIEGHANGHTCVDGVCTTCIQAVPTITLDDVLSILTAHSDDTPYSGTAGADYVDKMFDGETATAGAWNDNKTEYYPSAVGDYLLITLKNEIYLKEAVFWIFGNYSPAKIEFFDASGSTTYSGGCEFNIGDAFGGDAGAHKIVLDTETKVKSIKVTHNDLKWDGKTAKISEIELFVSNQHNWIFKEYETGNEPTCTSEGNAIFECLGCGDTMKVPALHRFTYFVEHLDGQAPTCTAYGYSTFECLYCTESETRFVPPTHSYDPVQKYPATCTLGSITDYTCTVCGDCYREESEPNGHNKSFFPISSTVTCTEDGVEIYSCYNCSELVVEEVEATGHNWEVDENTIDVTTHTATASCTNDGCGQTTTVSTVGMEQDPIATTVPSTISVTAGSDWVYYTFEHQEGILTITLDKDTYYLMVKDTSGKYETQFFWGGETEITAELMASGTYVIAVSSGSDAEVELNITTAFEEKDLPDYGEASSKPIVIESTNTEYTSTGTTWFKYQTEYAGKVTITVTGTATVKYGENPEELTAYTAPFDDVYGYTVYYICVESTEEVTIKVGLEAPVGSMDNPFELASGDNAITVPSYSQYYTKYTADKAGKLTVSYDSSIVINVGYGYNPYMLMGQFDNGKAIIDVVPNDVIYIGFNEASGSAVELTLAVSFEEASTEPTEEMGEKIGTLDVTVTETYGYTDEYTYTATNAGTYTFFVPANLGFYSKAQQDVFGDAEADFYSNSIGTFVSVELTAGQSYTFYVGSTTADTYTLDIYYAE